MAKTYDLLRVILTSVGLRLRCYKRLKTGHRYESPSANFHSSESTVANQVPHSIGRHAERLGCFVNRESDSAHHQPVTFFTDTLSAFDRFTIA